MTKNTQWLPEIGIARGLAIIAVLLIHGTGQSVSAVAPGTSAHYFYVFINRSTQFSVPLFIMISALILAYRSPKVDNVNWAEFYRKRWSQIVIPYLLWTTFYIIIARFVILGDTNYFSITHWLFWYLFGKGYFHLYFLAVIIQFYLLYPLILRAWRTFNPGFAACLIFFGALQVALYWINRIYIFKYFPYPGSLIISYVFPIGIAFWLGWNVQHWTGWWKKFRPVVIGTVVAAGAYYLQLNLFILANKKIDTFAFQMIWHLYVVTAGLVVIFAARELKIYAVRNWLSLAGELSFGIYLIHPFFLLLWQKAWGLLGVRAVHISTWGGLIFVLICSWTAIVFLRRFRFGSILLGDR